MSKLKGKARARANKKKRLQEQNMVFLRRKNLLAKIRKWNDPILKQVCEEVKPGEDVSEIIKELKSVLFVSKTGVGLSASQIGYSKQVIATHVNRESPTIDILINPRIIEKSAELSQEYEGCLSYPEIFVVVDRSEKIKVKFLNERMEEIVQDYSGFEARVIQHEVDHLSGVCVIYNAWQESLNKNKIEDTSEVVNNSGSATGFCEGNISGLEVESFNATDDPKI